MIIRHIIRSIREAVEPLYGPYEAESIARMVVSEKQQYNLSQLVVHYDDECEIADIETIIEELRSGRPVQYVLGKAEFCDMEFSVTEGNVNVARNKAGFRNILYILRCEKADIG